MLTEIHSVECFMFNAHNYTESLKIIYHKADELGRKENFHLNSVRYLYASPGN